MFLARMGFGLRKLRATGQRRIGHEDSEKIVLDDRNLKEG